MLMNMMQLKSAFLYSHSGERLTAKSGGGQSLAHTTLGGAGEGGYLMRGKLRGGKRFVRGKGECARAATGASSMLRLIRRAVAFVRMLPNLDLGCRVWFVALWHECSVCFPFSLSPHLCDCFQEPRLNQSKMMMTWRAKIRTENGTLPGLGTSDFVSNQPLNSVTSLFHSFGKFIAS